MKKVSIVVLCLLVSIITLGQVDQLMNLVEQGVELHKQGRYNEALAKFSEALEIDPNSAVANYEKAYTYFVMGEHPNAIAHCEKVLAVESDIDYLAYVVLGSSLNMLGDTEKAIKTFEKGLEKHPDDNLLNYNHALTCFQQGHYNKAEISSINGILARPGHPSSHLILAYTIYEKGERVKAMMPLYFFLFLEPGSNRSHDAYSVLMDLVSKGVEKKDEKNINLTISRLDDSQDFGMLEMFVSLLAASRYTEENENLNDLEFFASFNDSFFGILNEPGDENIGFWHEFYIPFFKDLNSSGHMEAFTYYISQAAYPEMVYEWVESNPEALEAFFRWTEE